MFLLYLVAVLSSLTDNNQCLEVKTTKTVYSKNEKYFRWTVSNTCDLSVYYLTGLEVKVDTGWKPITSYIHNLGANEFIGLQTAPAKKKITDAQSMRLLLSEPYQDRHFFRLTIYESKTKDIESVKLDGPDYVYFEIK